MSSYTQASSAVAHTALLHKGDQVVAWQLNCHLFFFLARLLPPDYPLTPPLTPFAPIFGSPHLCPVKAQCWSGSTGSCQTKFWVSSKSSYPLQHTAITCNYQGHGGIIPDSIPAWLSTGNWLLPLCLQSSASALRYLLGHTNNKTFTLVSHCLKAAETLN